MKTRLPPNIQNKLQNSVKELMAQAKKADVLVGELKEKLSKFDKKAARESIEQLKSAGLVEAKKVRDRLQTQLFDLTNELAKKSGKLKTESERVKSRVQETLTTMKTQLKNITEAERSKRRGRRSSRSE